jgi:hypothetical protein
MTDEDFLDQHAKTLVLELMLVMYSHGMTTVNVGGLMRMLGVTSESASLHDGEVVELTDEFAKYIKETRNTKRPDDATLH